MAKSKDLTVAVSLFLANLESLRGIPYIWGGKNAHGLDCSGVVTFALKQSDGPDLTQMWNCPRLIQECWMVKDGIPHKTGMLAFYGVSDKAPSHVMTLYPSSSKPGTLAVYGGAGGNHHTTTKEAAQKLDACVKERDSIQYRHDLLGVYRWSRLDYEK